jgi:hypothetical protein
LNSIDFSEEFVTSIFSVEEQVKQETGVKQAQAVTSVDSPGGIRSYVMLELYETSNDAVTLAPEKRGHGAK